MSSEFHPDKPEAENELQSRASTRSTVSVAESVAEPAEGWARPTLTAGLDRLIEMIRIPDRLATPASQDANSEEHAQPRGLVLRPALLGFVALLAISIGASMPSSPFKLEMPGTWFFGVPQSGGASTWGVYFVLAAVYGGLLLLMRVWWGMTRLYARRPGIPVRQLMWVFGLWSLPMLVIAPLFSRDVYSYAAQGEMVSHHMNPYLYGPYQLGNNSFTAPVDPLWGNTPAPYGPLFLQIDGFFARITFHNELATIVLLRLLAYAGVLLIAFCIPRLARLYHRDGAELFTLAVLNPVVILHLIGGAHNDALMLGLLLAGITLAKEKRPVLGVILCALATAIKAPAAIGIIYIGWGWLGPSAPKRDRIRPIITSGLIGLGVLAFFSYTSGLGWGWVQNLATPGAVRSWMAPSTAVAFVGTDLAHLVHVGVGLGGVLTVTRFLGLLVAVGGRGLAAVEQRPDRAPEGVGPHPAPLRPPRARGPALVSVVGIDPVGARGRRPPALSGHRPVDGHRLPRAARCGPAVQQPDPRRPALDRADHLVAAGGPDHSPGHLGAPRSGGAGIVGLARGPGRRGIAPARLRRPG